MQNNINCKEIKKIKKISTVNGSDHKSGSSAKLGNNTNKSDYIVAWLVLLVFIIFGGYLFYLFIPGWFIRLSSETTIAKTEDRYSKDGYYYVEYSFYNNNEEKVVLKRKIVRKSDFEKYGNANKIQYNKRFPNRIYFVNIDVQLPLWASGLIILIDLMILIRIIKVLQNRLTLYDVFGFSK